MKNPNFLQCFWKPPHNILYVEPNAISTLRDAGPYPGFLSLSTTVAPDSLIWDAAPVEIAWFWHNNRGWM